MQDERYDINAVIVHVRLCRNKYFPAALKKQSWSLRKYEENNEDTQTKNEKNQWSASLEEANWIPDSKLCLCIGVY